MSTSRQDYETGPLPSYDSPSDFDLAEPAEVEHGAVPQLAGDRYHLSEVIALGGMGAVYHAYDQLLHRDVAIKILREDHKMSPAAVDEFIKEALVMSYLSHPGVTPIYELGRCKAGRPYHVMKLVNGSTLREMLSKGQTGIAELLRVFTHVCQTIAFAHSRGVVHLDLKPANIMVVPFGEVNVLDWGLAQRCGEVEVANAPQRVVPIAPEHEHHFYGKPSTNITVRQCRVSGTPEYMSPEQARGRRLDARADVFSLGGILAEILCGEAPYQGTRLSEVYLSAAQGKTHRILEKLHGCRSNEAIVRLAINCLNTNAKKRPPDAMVLAKAMVAHQDSTLERVQSDMDRFFELSLDLFCIADLDGYFVRINSNFAKVLGHCEAELLSRPFLDFVHEDDRSTTIDQMTLLNEGKPVIRFRNRYKTAAGSYVQLEWTAKRVEAEQLVFAVARDVTG